MRTPALSAIAAGLSLATVAHANGVVQWDIQKKDHHHPTHNKQLRRRAGTQQEVIHNYVSRGGYFATCSVGTPAQDLVLQLDTGSSDIWVPASQAAVCAHGDCNLGTCASCPSFLHPGAERNQKLTNMGAYYSQPGLVDDIQ